MNVSSFKNPDNPPNTRIITTGVRPPRVAVFIDRVDTQWMHTCLRVIEWNTAHWGGWNTCLIPTDGEEITEPFWAVLEAFDPDYLYTYQKTGLDYKIASPEDFQRDFELQFEAFMQKWPDQDRDDSKKSFLQNRLGQEQKQFELSEGLKEQLYSRINPFSGSDKLIHGFTARSDQSSGRLTSIIYPFEGFAKRPNPERIEDFLDVTMNASLPVQLMVHSLHGKLWPAIRSQIHAPGNVHMSSAHLSIEDAGNILQDLWEREDHLYEGTVAAASLLKCAFYYPVNSAHRSQPLVIIVGNEIEDYCLYHSLSRLRRNVIWLPQHLLDAYRIRVQEEKEESQDKQIIFDGEQTLIYKAFLLLTRQSKNRDETRFSSISISDSDLLLIAEQFIEWFSKFGGETQDFSAQIEPNVSSLLPTTRRLYEINNDANRFREQFYKGDSLNILTPPRPKQFGHIPPTNFFWITEAIIEGYKLPARPEFGPLTVHHPNYDSGEVRVTAEGFGFFCPYIASGFGDLDRTLVRPTIHLLSDLEVFRLIFSNAGYDVRYSDKGNYQLQCTEKFGDLTQLSDFLRSLPHQKLLEKYVEGSSGQIGIRLRERRYLTFGDIENLLGDKNLSVQTIDDLSCKGVLYRGFIFKCEACRNADWYPIESVTHEFVCSRCRISQRYTAQHWREHEEPKWYYQLDEIVYQAFSNNFHVPVLTLRLLQDRAKSSFFYVPELEIRTDVTSPKPDCELDVVCCIDGKIVIGECKRRNDAVSKSDLNRYKDVADAIRADKIIFSTIDAAWGNGTIQNAIEIIGAQRVEMLSVQD